MKNIPLRIAKYYHTYCASLANRLRRCVPLPRSLFIAKFDGLGDFFLLLPLLKKLIEASCRITLCGGTFQREILAHCGLDAATIPFCAAGTGALREALAAAATVRPEHAVNLSMNIWGGILVNHTRSPDMVGLLQEREWYVYKGTKLLYDRTVSYEKGLHSFEVNGRLFDGMLGIGRCEPHFERPAAAGIELAIHPFASWPPRRWPHFEEMIRRLTDAGYRCAVLGTASELADGGSGGRLENIAGCRVETLRSVGHLCREIDRCRAFIGSDSGPAHYAAITGKKTFVLWGPGNFNRVKPLGREVHIFMKDIDCRPCRQRGAVCGRGRNDCLRMITVDEVAEKVMAVVPRK